MSACPAIVPAPEDLAGIVDAIGAFGAVTTSLVLKSEMAKPIGPSLLAHRGRRKTRR